MLKEPTGLILQPPGLRDAPFKAPGDPKHEILVQHSPRLVLMLDKDYSEQQSCIQTELRDFIPWISLGSAHLGPAAALNLRLQHF